MKANAWESDSLIPMQSSDVMALRCSKYCPIASAMQGEPLAEPDLSEMRLSASVKSCTSSEAHAIGTNANSGRNAIITANIEAIPKGRQRDMEIE